ncbi:MAG: hypothetical protein HQK54_01155 [Oligoflexales bacterium]|nr:hypothetical protein [Oligoflexales bacterium]
MHELTCPTCGNSSKYVFTDYLLLCPFCSATFKVDIETGQKEIFGDHYIIINTIDAVSVKSLAMEWLKRLHHKPNLAEREFFVTDIQGMSVPYWIVSMEGHTVWKGLVKRQNNYASKFAMIHDYLQETGQFRRSYRWCISARSNICETWGFTRLHEPPEGIKADWDGFPLDSTFSRGRLTDSNEMSAYDSRKFFEFKFSNGLPILGIQVSEDEALRRARTHIELYHHKLASLNVDYLIDCQTELEIAGIQLIHIPFWKVNYVFTPKTSLKYFFKPNEKQILIDGFNKGVINGELALVYLDKIKINAIVCAISAVLLMIMGILWHPAFFLVSMFSLSISLICAYLVISRKAKQRAEELRDRAASFDKKETFSFSQQKAA